MSESAPSESENLQQFLPDHGVTNERRTTFGEGTRCPKCGYDLRGLTIGRPCPECGRSTRDIDRGSLATDLDGEYLHHVRLGLRLIALSWILVIPPPLISVFTYIPMSLILWLMNIGLLLLMIGAFLLVSRTAFAITSGIRPSIAERIAIFAPIGALAFIGYAHFRMAQSIMGVAPPAFLTLGFVCLIVSHVTICMAGEKLARRLDDEWLGDKFWALAWAIPLTGVIGVPIGAWMLGGMVLVICLAGLFFTFAFYVAEIAFFCFVVRLSRITTWTLRYQHAYAERSDRLREQRESGQKTASN